MNPARQLREDRAKLAKDMVELAAGGLKTAEDRTKYDKMDADQKQLLEQITRIEAASNLEAEMRRSGPPPSGQPGGENKPSDKEKAERHQKLFRTYLQRGGKGLNADEWQEFRDMGVAGEGTGAATGSGILVPVGFVNDIESALKYYGPMLDGGAGMPTIMPTMTGQSLPWPTDNDTTTSGELIGEGQQVTTGDVSFGQVTFSAYKYSSKMVRVSMELLQDSAFGLDGFLIKKFAERLGRILNTHMTVGTGTGQPNGIVTASTLGGTAVGSVGNDGTGGFNTIGSDDLTTLEHSVDPLYRRGARYMFHDSTLANLKKLKDKYGRPLWMPDVREGQPDTINGYAYGINNDMDQLQTQANSPTVTRKTVLFGDLTKYTIRRVKEMSVLRLTERFADYGQVAFIAFARYDGQLLDAGTHPVKYLQNIG